VRLVQGGMDRYLSHVAQAWSHLLPHVVVPLVVWPGTRFMHHLLNNEEDFVSKPDRVIIAAFVPGRDHLRTAQVIERIAHHVTHLCALADDPTISRRRRETSVSAWARVIAAGAAR